MGAIESLEPRQVLAVTGLPASAGDQFGVAIVLGTNGVGPNDLTITLDDTTKAGVVAATITANTQGGVVTRSYWNFGNSISFTGTADTDGSVVNSVKVSSLFGGDLTNGLTKFDWTSTLDWTPRGLPDVAVSLKYADSLSLESPPTAANPITIAGTFNSPTLAPSATKPGAAITVGSNSIITVGAAGVSTYNLTLASTANGAAAGIDLKGAVTTVNDVALSSFNDLSIGQPVTAGGKATIGTAGAVAPAGSVSVSAVVVAGGDLTISAKQDLATTVGGSLRSTAGSVFGTAQTGSASFAATVTASAAITLGGNTGVSTTAAAALLAATGNVAITSGNGNITTVGSITATAGAVTATATKLAVSTTKIAALSGIALSGNTDVEIGDDTAVTGGGAISATAATGNVRVLAAAPVTVADGAVSLTATAGRIDVNSLVQANQAIKLTAAQGIAIDDATDLTTAILSTGLAGSVEIATDAQQVLLNAPVSAVAGTGTVKISSAQNDVIVRRDILAGAGLTVSGKTTVDVNGQAADITLTSLTGTVAITSTAAGVVLGDKLGFVAGPGADAGLALTAVTTVTVPFALDAQGNITIVSPDGFTLQQRITSALGTVAVTAASGGLAVTAAPISAGGAVTLSSLNQLDVGSGITSTGAGISLTSTGGGVNLQAASSLNAADATKGTLGIDAQTAITMGIDLVAGNSIVLTTGAPFTPTKNITSTNGNVTVSSSGGDLDVRNSTMSALLGSVVLAASAGKLDVDMSKVLANAVTGDLTLTAGAAVAMAAGPISVGGDITITSNSGFAPAVGSDLRSANGDIKLIYSGPLDVSNIKVEAPQGAIALQSKTSDVTIGTKSFVVSGAATGTIALTADAGTVMVGQNLTAGGNLAITLLNTYTATKTLTSTAGDVSVQSTTGNVATTGQAVTAGGAISLAATAGNVTAGVLTSGGTASITSGGTTALGGAVTGGTGVAVASVGTATVGAAVTATSGNVSVTSSAGDVTATANVGTVRANAGSITLTSTVGAVRADALNAGGAITLTSKQAAMVTAAVTSTGGAVSVTSASGDVTTNAGTVTAGGAISLAATAGNVTAGVLTSGGTTSITSGGTTALGGAVTGGTGVSVVSVANATVGAAVTATSGNVSVTSSAGDVTATANVGTVRANAGSITLTSTVGAVRADALNAGGAITLTSKQAAMVTAAVTSTGGAVSVTSASGDVTTTAQTVTAGGAISLAATAGNVAAGVLTSGGTTSITSGGTTALSDAVTAGTSVAVSSQGTATITKAVTAMGGSLSITSISGDVNAAAVTAAIAAPVGAISLLAPVGSVLLNAANPLAAPAGVNLISGADLQVTAAVSSNAGSITLASNAGDVIISKAMTAPVGIITINAFDEVKGLGANGAINTTVLANGLVVTAGYGQLGTSPVAFTSVANDVDTLSITLASAGVPIGTGIEYVDANALTVNAAVTATGVVDISSVGGSLTLAGSLGGVGQSLSGAELRAKDALSVVGGIAVTTLGNITLTSDDNAVSVTGGVAAAQGTVTLRARGAISVAGALGVEVLGVGDISATSNASNINIAGPVTANSGAVSLESTGGLTGVTVGGVVFATGAITIRGDSGVQVTQSGIAVQSTAGAVVLESTNGNVAATGDVQTNSGDVRITARNGVVTLDGGVTAGVNNGDDVVVTAGPLLQVTGSVFAGGNCEFKAAAGINLGPAGGVPNSVTANSGRVLVESSNGAVIVNSDIVAAQGSIDIKTAGTVTFTGGELTVSPTYVAGAPASGLVAISGTLGITANTNPVVQAGRLEVVSSGGGNVAFTSANNQVSTLRASTAGDFTFVNAIPLSLTDFDGLVPSAQVSGQNVNITSPQGLRVVDGIKYTGTLTLTASSAARGVEFVPSATGDNAAAGAPFAGTLRDMVSYVNANVATKQAMSIVFDEPGTRLATTSGEISLTASLPNVTKQLLFDGVLPTGGANVGGNVGVRGNGVPAAAAANGLTLAAGSSGSTISNAYFSEFAGAGVSVLSSGNLLTGLTIGARRTNVAAANGVGIDLFGGNAARNTIGVAVIGRDAPNVIVNNTTVGVRIRAGANYNGLYGNFIGVTQAGQAAGNGGDGVLIAGSIGTVVGSTTAVLGNQIGSNGGSGVRLNNVSAQLLPYGVQVIGNEIADNVVAGVFIAGGGKNMIGGTAVGMANTIARNGDGVVLSSSVVGVTQGNVIVGNIITDSARYGAFVDLAHGNTIDGNIVRGSGNTGIRIARATTSRTQLANQVVRNVVSFNGDDSTSNAGGIVLENSSGQMVGRLAAGSNAAYGNTVTENLGSGIVVQGGATPGGASFNVIENNVVGDTLSGVPGGNTKDGIRIVGGITNTIRANTVRNNGANGISLVDARAPSVSTGNVVAGNVVGLNNVGVYVAGGANNLIGGTLAAAGNRIFSSNTDGLLVESSPGTGEATATVIRNNVVGRDASNNAAGNGAAGIRLADAIGTVIDYGNIVARSGANGVVIQGGRNNVVGAAIAGRGNIIVNNVGDGVRLDAPVAPPALTQAVTVAGNMIRGNSGYGVNAVGLRTSGVTIGRTPSISRPTGAENTIRDNGAGGVQVDAAVAVTIVGNEIVNNGPTPADSTLQISLVNNGNSGVRAPILTAATKRVAGQASPQYDVSGTVAGVSGQRFFVDLYGVRTADGRQFFLGRVSVTVGRNGVGSFRAIVGSLASQLGNGSVDQIVATATPASSLNGGTSAFSNPRNV